MILCENIKTLRAEKGLLQRELANLLKTSNSTICDWERGRCEPSIEDLIKLADIFGVSVGYLIGHEDDFGVVKVKNELTTSEETLLGYYRKLNEHDKHKVLGFVQALAY